MKIDIHGKRSYLHSREEIYNCILILPEIVKSFPVIDEVEQRDDATYVFTFSLNFGMYSGAYTGTLFIIDQREPEYLHLKATHQSVLGKLFIEVQVRINEITPDKNRLSIEGYFDVRGMMRFAGGRMLKNGVANGLEIMFDFLEERIAIGREEE